MKDHWKSILIALTIFCAGLFTGILTQHPWAKNDKHHMQQHQSPFSVMQEFGPPDDMPPMPPRDKDGFCPLPPFSAEAKAYDEKIQNITSVYRKKMRDVLTPAQQAAFDKMIDAPPHPPEGFLPPPPPPPRQIQDQKNDHSFPHDPPYIRTGPTGGELRFVGMIIFKPILEHVSNELKLDEKQKSAITSIMEARRAELLKFVDSNPPPTIQMTLKQK